MSEDDNGITPINGHDVQKREEVVVPNEAPPPGNPAVGMIVMREVAGGGVLSREMALDKGIMHSPSGDVAITSFVRESGALVVRVGDRGTPGCREFEVTVDDMIDSLRQRFSAEDRIETVAKRLHLKQCNGIPVFLGRKALRIPGTKMVGIDCCTCGALVKVPLEQVG